MAPAPGTGPESKGARLLLAEDEEDVLVTLAAVLRQEGYDVTPVRSAAEGCQTLRTSSFDLIVTDMRMEHETSGLELVSEAHRLDPQAVAIVLTGYGSFPSAVESLQAGVFDYLTKPSNLEQLKQAIARGLERRRLNQALVQAERAEAARLAAEQHAREAMLRADVSVALAERSTLEDILHRCAEALVKHLDAAYARIFVLNPEAGILELKGTAGVAAVSGPLTRNSLPVGRWKVGRAASEKRPVFSEDLANDPEFSDQDWARREGMNCFAGYPMVVEDRTIGAVALFSRAMFSQETLAAMGPIAAAIAQGIDRRRAEDERDRLLVAEQEARTRAEAAERRLQRIIDALPEAVVVVDPKGHALLWNAAAAGIVGQLDPAIAFTERAVWRMDGSPYAAQERPLARAILHGEIIQSEQLVVHNQITGDHIPILINAAPIYSAEGQLLGGVSVFQDITSLKELEQQKADFLSAAAHDLKTPLTTVKGLVQLLERQLGRATGASETTAATLANVDAAASKMASLIDELLDVSQLNMNTEIDLMLDQVDLVALARRVVEAQRQATERHQLRLSTQLAALEGRWDPDRIERALANLVSNAVKYSPAGGEVLVEIRQEESHGSRWAVATVIDHGVGIPAADLPHIFDRFQRGGNVRGRIAGTGIGLAYVHEIARRHGGSVEVQSQEGRGSTLTLRLPLDSD